MEMHVLLSRQVGAQKRVDEIHTVLIKMKKILQRFEFEVD
jgi:hypothetical protein